MKIEAKIIIEDGVVSFYGEQSIAASQLYRDKLEEVKEEGKQDAIKNILHNIEKIAEKRL